MRLLLYVLLAPRAAHSYASVLLPSLALPGYTFINLKLAGWQSGASQQQPHSVAIATGRSIHFFSVNSSQVWRAECVALSKEHCGRAAAAGYRNGRAAAHTARGVQFSAVRICATTHQELMSL
ncbi:hypothetical protein JKP88DRAFT_299996 [Tribonema minus]|uniref:Secreted protein n=1 Tax=Tribonema minus TaxID=303371 RepID=A0A836CCN7_9STRA|nr:hypothetical protein JKP88DRAFT_324563 [Tribonema minus]KAG5190040.1 hypothetical protein JKP88DRAFT_299996 [Tribonema minus]